MRTSLLVASLVFAACSSKAPTPPANSGGSSSRTTPSDTTCTADPDCVVIETACCDHCNGGKVEAFNKASADAHKATGCEDTMCTQMACGAATASCDAGSCKVTIQPL